MSALLRTEDTILFTENVTEANYFYPIFEGNTSVVLDFTGVPASREVNFNFPMMPYLFTRDCSFQLTGTLRNTIVRVNNVCRSNVAYIGLPCIVSIDADLYNSSLLISNTQAIYNVAHTSYGSIIAEGSVIGFDQVYVGNYVMSGNFRITNSIINVTNTEYVATALNLGGTMEHATVFITNTALGSNALLFYTSASEYVTNSTFYLQDIDFRNGSRYLTSYVSPLGYPEYYSNNSFYLMNCTGVNVVLSSIDNAAFLNENTIRGDQYTTVVKKQSDSSYEMPLSSQDLWVQEVGEGVGAMLDGCDDLCVGGTFSNCSCVCDSAEEKGEYCVMTDYYYEMYLSDAFTSTTLPPELSDSAYRHATSTCALIALVLLSVLLF